MDTEGYQLRELDSTGGIISSEFYDSEGEALNALDELADTLSAASVSPRLQLIQGDLILAEVSEDVCDL